MAGMDSELKLPLASFLGFGFAFGHLAGFQAAANLIGRARISIKMGLDQDKLTSLRK
jgi:hypothetical protein